MISEQIDRYIALTKQRWHTPGHKGLMDARDITEIDDSFPGDAVKRAQEETAKLLGCKYCRYLVGGSSMGIKAAVLALKRDILVAASSHRAIFEAARLAGVNAFTVQNERRDGLDMPLSALQIERELKAHPSVGAVYITSPDYYGFVSDVYESLKGKVYLFCDAAHGAHFSMSELFPRSYGEFADICNLSAHKTLPAYTQSAYLAVNNEELIIKVDDALKLLGTTSPSYLLLGGLEFAAKYAHENSERYFLLKERIDELRKCVPVVENDDFTRIVVDAKAMKMCGKELYFKLKNRGVVAEKFDDRYVVFIATVCDSPDKIDLLKEELCAVNL